MGLKAFNAMKPKTSPLSNPFLLIKTSVSNVPAVFVMLIFLTLCTAPSALSQIPQGFNYQAIVRDGSKEIIVSEPIMVRITIENSLAVSVYQEEHSTSTDEFGIMAIVIGEGTPSGTGLFMDIDWNNEPLYIKTEIQYPVGASYAEMGTAPLLYVPYAKVADSLSAPITKLLVNGAATSYEEPLFEVRNKDGNTVFAVFNEGVRIYVGDGEAGKGPKGGFAIGGFGANKDENDKRYLFVDDDSVRIYINDAAKSAKGGFAIGGYGATKGWSKYMKVTSDSTRIVTTDNEQGFGVSSGSSGSYMRLTPENYFIGQSAGRLNVAGRYNSFLGYNAGMENISGNNNTFLGFQAGLENTGSDNTFIGNRAGSSHQSKGGNVFIGSMAGENAIDGEQNILIGESTGAGITTGSYNVMMGYQSGMSNSEGTANVFIGQNAGFKNEGAGTTMGHYNVFVGYLSGYNNIEGQSNVFVGKQSGWNNTTGKFNTYIGLLTAGQIKAGDFNVFVGAQAGESKQRGSNNVFIGVGAGGGNLKGSGNIFIGNKAGYAEQDSNILYIENSDSGYPLIGGDFEADRVAINGKPDAAGATFQVNGSLRVGINGSSISRILKATESITIPSLNPGESSLQTVTVTNASINSTVSISPSSELPGGLVIAYARVSASGTVEIKFTNFSASIIIGDSYSFYLTLIN